MTMNHPLCNRFIRVSRSQVYAVSQSTVSLRMRGQNMVLQGFFSGVIFAAEMTIKRPEMSHFMTEKRIELVEGFVAIVATMRHFRRY